MIYVLRDNHNTISRELETAVHVLTTNPEEAISTPNPHTEEMATLHSRKPGLVPESLEGRLSPAVSS
jgi:hypothetical protein